MSHHPRRARAFTLVELLVVISIIALLIAILTPSLASARRQARTVVCLSQESQLGVAMQIYANRNRDYLPQIWGGSVKWGEERGVLYKLMVSSGVMPRAEEFPRVLVCPDARPRDSISYALNAVPFGYRHPSPDGEEGEEEDPLTGMYVPPMQMNQAARPGRVVALYDVRAESLARVWGTQVDRDEADMSDQFTGTASHDWVGRVRPNPPGFMWQQTPDEPPYTAEPPHGKAHNVLFLDTHAATYRSWQPDDMTRLTGWSVNDEPLF